MAKTDFRFFIYNVSQRHSIYVILISSDRVKKDVPKSLKAQSNSDTFFLIEMSKNIFLMSKSSRMNSFENIEFKVRSTQNAASVIFRSFLRYSNDYYTPKTEDFLNR